MTNVATVEKMQPPIETARRADPMISMLERVLTDPSIPVERLERLLELQNVERDRQAKILFSERMSAAQSEMRAVLKDRDNSHTRSKYASYAALDDKVRPIYTAHGFSVTFNTERTDAPDLIRIVAFVENAGFERRYEVEMPCDGKGAKSGDVMTKTHAVKSAVTYGKATLLPMIFNIAVTDRADDDGSGASAGPSRYISDDQVTELRELLASTGANFALFLKAAKVESLDEIPAASFDRLCESVRRRAAARCAQ